jgi:hypothetical protein
MDYPNRKRLVLAFVALAACSVGLAADMNVEKKAPNDARVVQPVMDVSSIADRQPSTPAHRSVAIESPNRSEPVPGD